MNSLTYVLWLMQIRWWARRKRRDPRNRQVQSMTGEGS